MSDDNDTIFGFPVATVSFVEQDLRAQLAAMTERRDMWRRVALAYRWDRNEHLRHGSIVAGEHIDHPSEWIPIWSAIRRGSRQRRQLRREARNG